MNGEKRSPAPPLLNCDMAQAQEAAGFTVLGPGTSRRRGVAGGAGRSGRLVFVTVIRGARLKEALARLKHEMATHHHVCIVLAGRFRRWEGMFVACDCTGCACGDNGLLLGLPRVFVAHFFRLPARRQRRSRRSMGSFIWATTMKWMGSALAMCHQFNRLLAAADVVLCMIVMIKHVYDCYIWIVYWK
jgi:hypothetical protein